MFRSGFTHKKVISDYIINVVFLPNNRWKERFFAWLSVKVACQLNSHMKFSLVVTRGITHPIKTVMSSLAVEGAFQSLKKQLWWMMIRIGIEIALQVGGVWLKNLAFGNKGSLLKNLWNWYFVLSLPWLHWTTAFIINLEVGGDSLSIEVQLKITYY